MAATTTDDGKGDSPQEHGGKPQKMDLLAGCPRLGLLADRFGNKFYVGNAGRFWMPPFPIGPDNDYRSHVTGITNMAIRDDDILVCSYPKAGLHWQLEIMNMLRYNSTDYDKDGMFFKYSLDLNRQPPTGEADAGKPRIIVTHIPFDHIPRQALKKKIKILYLNRNPKDVMVAFYNHMSNHTAPLNFPGSFEHFVRLTLDVGYYYSSWFDHTLSFNQGMKEYPDVPFLTSMYEDLKKDPVGGVSKLNEFLGTGCNGDMCKKIAEACDISKVKPFKEANRSQIEKSMFKEGTTSFYRKGDVGDWKNWFSPELNKDFDEACQRILAGCDFKFQYQ